MVVGRVEPWQNIDNLGVTKLIQGDQRTQRQRLSGGTRRADRRRIANVDQCTGQRLLGCAGLGQGL
jgi:hypothetical protein